MDSNLNMTENKLLKAQATKNGLQAGSIVSGITYVWAVLEVLSGWPWWAKGLLILMGIVGLSAVFYIIWRLNTSQVKDLADKARIVGQAIAELLSLFLPFVQAQEDTEPDNPVTPTWPGVVIAKDTDGVDKAFIAWADFDKTKIKVQAAPIGLMTIVYTYKGQTWEDKQSRFDQATGIIYSIVADPTADNVPAPIAQDVLNELLEKPEPLREILKLIPDSIPLKLEIALSQAQVNEISGDPVKLDAFVKDASPFGLGAMLENYLRAVDRDLARLRTDKLFWKYYKGA